MQKIDLKNTDSLIKAIENEISDASFWDFTFNSERWFTIRVNDMEVDFELSYNDTRWEGRIIPNNYLYLTEGMFWDMQCLKTLTDFLNSENEEN